MIEAKNYDIAKKEIEIQKKLSHPNIIKIIDYNEELHPDYVKLDIIMEYADSIYIYIYIYTYIY